MQFEGFLYFIPQAIDCKMIKLIVVHWVKYSFHSISKLVVSEGCLSHTRQFVAVSLKTQFEMVLLLVENKMKMRITQRNISLGERVSMYTLYARDGQVKLYLMQKISS